MSLKNPRFNYDFQGWDDDCLALNRGLLEETIDEAHVRENVVYSRVGSLLALNGVILAVICTFVSRANINDDSAAMLLSAGICALVVSILILGYILIPPWRLVVNAESCETDPIYYSNRNNKTELQKAMIIDRTNLCLDVHTLLESMTMQLTLALITTTIGLGLLGSALTTSILDDNHATMTYFVIAIPIIVFTILYALRAKYKEQDDNE